MTKYNFTIRYSTKCGMVGSHVSAYSDVKSAVNDFLELSKDAGIKLKGYQVYTYTIGDEYP